LGFLERDAVLASEILNGPLLLFNRKLAGPRRIRLPRKLILYKCVGVCVDCVKPLLLLQPGGHGHLVWVHVGQDASQRPPNALRNGSGLELLNAQRRGAANTAVRQSVKQGNLTPARAKLVNGVCCGARSTGAAGRLAASKHGLVDAVLLTGL
jgi:hypothetical protein